jgi:hypothetical protein
MVLRGRIRPIRAAEMAEADHIRRWFCAMAEVLARI